MTKNLFALMHENDVLYSIGIHKGHAFRVYPNGKIGKANNQEQELAIKFCKKQKGE